jgi:hypothetical protein
MLLAMKAVPPHYPSHSLKCHSENRAGRINPQPTKGIFEPDEFPAIRAGMQHAMLY